MGVQKAVNALYLIGPFPDSDDSDAEAKMELIEPQVTSIEIPISDDDARALVKLFGPDTFYGLAWSLVSAIETAPGWPLRDALIGERTEWKDLLIQRAINGGFESLRDLVSNDAGAHDRRKPDAQ